MDRKDGNQSISVNVETFGLSSEWPFLIRGEKSACMHCPLEARFGGAGWVLDDYRFLKDKGYCVPRVYSFKIFSAIQPLV